MDCNQACTKRTAEISKAASLRHSLLAGLLAIAIGAVGSAAAGAQKTDVVYLVNGDRITCEVKKLDRGKLSVSTDSMGSVSIDWKDVARLVASKQFEVELAGGERLFGSISPAEAERTVTIRGDDEIAVPLASVVTLTQIAQRFWKRFDGSLSLGLNFAQASDTKQLSFETDIGLRSRKFERRLTLSSLISDRRESESTSRQDLSFLFTRHFPKRQFSWSVGQAQSNEDLGLDLRLLLSSGFGQRFVQTNRYLFQGGLGLAATLEEIAGSAERQESFEGVLVLSFAKFISDDPEVDLDTSLIVYPSLSQSGRVRVELQARLRRELIEDFYLNLTVLNSFDSESPAVDANENDLALITSLGWSF